MKKQISFFDIIRFIIALIVFFYISITVGSWGEPFRTNASKQGSIDLLLLAFFFTDFLANLVSILVSLIFLRWNYKLITGMLFLFIQLLAYILDFSKYTSNWIIFLLYAIRLSMVMIGGAGAILIWNVIRDKFKAKLPKISIADLKIGKAKPKTSFLLLLLSLFSIPLTYITMFFSAFITLGVSALFFYFIIRLPRIPIAVIVVSILAPLVGLWAGIRALWVMFFPPIQFEPVTVLDITRYTTLKKIIDNVCRKVRARNPSTVVLHSEPNFFVMQGKLSTFDGIVKGRILAIGEPLLKEMNSLELSSILAHEFAHFTGRDTLYSTIVSPVYRGITASMNELSGATEGSSSDNNTANLMKFLLLPSQIFLGLFLQYFATIERILSRSRELRADWVAANCFGADIFSSALTKVTTISQHFNDNYENLALNSEIDFFDKHSKFLQSDPSKLEEYRKKALSLQEGDFDSHPSFATRLMNLPDKSTEKSDITDEIQNVRIELLEKERELSKKYTNRIKKIKEFFEQFQNMLEDMKKKKK